MFSNSTRQRREQTSAFGAWPRLTLVASILGAYTVISLSGGVAHADETSGPGDGSGATTSQGGTETPASASATTETSGAKEQPTTAVKIDPPASGPSTPADQQQPSVTPAGVVDAVQTTGTIKPSPTPAADPVVVMKEPTTTPKLAESPPAASEPAKTTASPTPTPTPTPSSSGPTSSIPTSSIPTPSTSIPTPSTEVAANPNRSEPQSPHASEPEASQEATVSALTVRRAAAPPSNNAVPLAAVSTPAPSLVSVPVPPTDPAQLIRQAAGLVSDGAIIAVSVVHTVADAVAQAFGPDSFLGVPYLLATTLANVAAAAGSTLVGGGIEDTATGPFRVTYGILDGLAFFNPTKPPAGANDPSIGITAEHPLPIILLNGTTATQGTNFSVGAAVLANAGYKVYSFNYGNTTGDPNSPIQAIADIRQSGQELADEVQMVLDDTGASQVILIGHSQGGGILPSYYINNLGGDEYVSQLIGIAPSNHGTDVDGLIALQSLPIFGPLFVDVINAIGPAFEQQALGSAFQDEVYGAGDTRGDVLYTTIASVNDEVVTPYTQQALTATTGTNPTNPANVTNIVVQDQYPGLVIGHLGVILSPQVWNAVLGALAANSAASPALAPALSAA